MEFFNDNENNYVITNLDNVITVNSLVAAIQARHNSMVKDNTTFFHNFWQLIYTQSGEVTWKIDGEVYRFEKDDFIITPPHTARKYVDSVEGTTMHFISFYSNSKKLKNIQKQLVHLTPKLKRKLVSAIADINNHFDKHLIFLTPSEKTSDIDLQRIKNKLERFLLDLYSSRFSEEDSSTKQKSHISQYEYFTIMITYLQNNLHRDLTISEIVTETGIGRSTLENIFQKNEGIGVKAYFTRMKIDEAKAMIISKNHSMTDIAQKLGFSNVHNFSRTFKAHTGVSPKKYQSYF